jgi:hypothetical protein
MAQAKGITAYPTARALLDRALETERGIKVEFPSYAAAFKMRMNCYTVRSRERKESIKLYDESHPLHGATPWDSIEMLILDQDDREITSKIQADSGPHFIVFRIYQELTVEEL